MPWAYLEFGEDASVPEIVAFNAIAAGIDRRRKTSALSGPRGRKPRRTFRGRNIMIYGTLIVVALYYLLPLYVMVVTSLKGMPEIRLGNIFAPPRRNHLRALGEGLDERLHRPQLRRPVSAASGTRCSITVPSSVIVSIAIASVNGYALANWRFKGAELFFTILIVGAFIPYQVMIYPIVIMLRELGVYGTLTGLIIVSHHLRHADPDAAVPQLFRLAAGRTVQGGARRRRRVLDASIFQHHAADVAADLRCGDDPAGHRHLERLPVRRGVHPARNITR